MVDDRVVPLVIALAVASAVTTSASCFEPRQAPPQVHRSSCTTCHGSATRAGDEVLRSAPPFDLLGRTDPSLPSVGAHLHHLTGSDVHTAIACETCHVVPDATDSPGHADDSAPADIIFSGLARHLGHEPSYDSGTASCTDTYCHGDAEVPWVPATTPELRCVRCHQMPPPAPHPAVRECELCHGAVVDGPQSFRDPALHVDGTVQVDERCDACHGDGDDGWPPPSLSGASDPTSIGVGAHARHLIGGDSGRGVPCATCHLVPEAVSDEGHLDASPNAEVRLTGIAVNGGGAPAWDRDTLSCAETWCHSPSGGGASPSWIAAQSSTCTSCHQMPPPAPHPQMSTCDLCHGEVAGAANTIVARDRHVDGVVDVAVPNDCVSCHGTGATGVPPPALDGSLLSSAPGVGAHAVHLDPGGDARPVACEECHEVPVTVLALGHLDSMRPAEMTFSGVAKSFGATPTYDGATCADTWCHGGRTAFGFPSGGQHTTPLWTMVDGSQAYCTSCHAMPPPTPAHPPAPTLCSPCHSNVVGLAEFLDPLRHVDGRVDL